MSDGKGGSGKRCSRPFFIRQGPRDGARRFMNLVIYLPFETAELPESCSS